MSLNTHLHILHIPHTGEPKTDEESKIRLDSLIHELDYANVKDYTIIEGFYEGSNTKMAIHKGHARIVKLAKEQGFDNCIIAEDDIKFSSPDSYEYFIRQIPESYDLFSGLIYHGSIDENNKILNGANGIMTLYSIHARFYDFFLSLDTNTHVDIELGNTSFKHEYFICHPFVCFQRNGYSFNRRNDQNYDVYLENKKLYGVT